MIDSHHQTNSFKKIKLENYDFVMGENTNITILVSGLPKNLIHRFKTSLVEKTRGRHQLKKISLWFNYNLGLFHTWRHYDDCEIYYWIIPRAVKADSSHLLWNNRELKNKTQLSKFDLSESDSYLPILEHDQGRTKFDYKYFEKRKKKVRRVSQQQQGDSSIFDLEKCQSEWDLQVLIGELLARKEKKLTTCIQHNGVITSIAKNKEYEECIRKIACLDLN
jgi:hypothetical protein